MLRDRCDCRRLTAFVLAFSHRRLYTPSMSISDLPAFVLNHFLRQTFECIINRL